MINVDGSLGVRVSQDACAKAHPMRLFLDTRPICGRRVRRPYREGTDFAFALDLRVVLCNSTLAGLQLRLQYLLELSRCFGIEGPEYLAGLRGTCVVTDAGVCETNSQLRFGIIRLRGGGEIGNGLATLGNT